MMCFIAQILRLIMTQIQNLETNFDFYLKKYAYK